MIKNIVKTDQKRIDHKQKWYLGNNCTFSVILQFNIKIEYNLSKLESKQLPRLKSKAGIMQGKLIAVAYTLRTY